MLLFNRFIHWGFVINYNFKLQILSVGPVHFLKKIEACKVELDYK